MPSNLDKPKTGALHSCDIAPGEKNLTSFSYKRSVEDVHIKNETNLKSRLVKRRWEDKFRLASRQFHGLKFFEEVI